MADLIKDSTIYRIKQIELAEAEFYKTLIKTLDNRWKANRTTSCYCY